LARGESTDIAMCIGENSRVDAGRGDGVLRCILSGRGIRRGSGSGSGRGIIGNARAKRFMLERVVTPTQAA